MTSKKNPEKFLFFGQAGLAKFRKNVASAGMLRKISDVHNNDKSKNADFCAKTFQDDRPPVVFFFFFFKNSFTQFPHLIEFCHKSHVEIQAS